METEAKILEFKDEYFFLSNFFFCRIIYNHKFWTTSEHLFQALKTLDMEKREYIRSLQWPMEAKKEGRRVVLRDDWENIRDDVMWECIHRKFTQNPQIAKELIDTHPAYLCEGNYWHDNYWGNCRCKKCDAWVGLNRLGELLMKMREQLIEGNN